MLTELMLKLAEGKHLDSLEISNLRRELQAVEEVKNLAKTWVVPGTQTPIFSSIIQRIYPSDGKALASDTASITIPIPKDYKHLLVLGQARSTEAAYANVLRARFNGDTGTNYREQYHGGQNASASIGAFTGQAYFSIGDVNGTSATTGAAGGYVVFIPHYTNTVFWKNAMSIRGIPLVNASSEDLNILLSAFWQNTAAIESITFFPAAGSILAGSIISIYGIL